METKLLAILILFPRFGTGEREYHQVNPLEGLYHLYALQSFRNFE